MGKIPWVRKYEIIGSVYFVTRSENTGEVDEVYIATLLHPKQTINIGTCFSQWGNGLSYMKPQWVVTSIDSVLHITYNN